ncbi:MAG: chromosomal replication initiator protein DnaA [SAR86 cluster bacterium]|uniref:Chromosomal replication initiator protein DnaA n=1 Tax=SAR86 cluster bacterium TaxID=2030880 RepID=A0A368BRD5_9GAMM|nr:MAG: chromosomal replication initiation protein [Gammaproteobacteria bacterium TMED219]RCL39256.1 MAG: chromosomal replication initiator protein DnaA [SAR86 cluster bacterium]|tara:strand:+ start:17188 stop:18486 length:1299 start_codon:yes stop_codon:yes gene_type:complete
MSNKLSTINIFNKGVQELQKQLNSTEFNSWIKPLEFDLKENNFNIYAPNSFVEDFFREKYLPVITNFLENHIGRNKFILNVSINEDQPKTLNTTGLNRNYTFDTFVEGKSNQVALAASKQVAEQAANTEYNPLFVYGGVGLGKTHLMHSIGNSLLQERPNAKICYVHSERFVSDMVKALQLGAINEFKKFYRNLNALLIDDIQFFAGKEQSQEELFHTFNSLIEAGNLMIFSCDRYPKEIEGLEERLKSRFGWGLSVVIDPPALETRAAILLKKADDMNLNLPDDCAFFIAQQVKSNVRELEGALKRVAANAKFAKTDINIDLIKDSLRDVLAIQAKMVTIPNIQRVVADYYNIKMSDLLSKRRNRSITRPRQIAMALSKELTNHSLPEIGEAFGGRDHTTVIHACEKTKELKLSNLEIDEDYRKLRRSLSA